jgi:hypothetical protein
MAKCAARESPCIRLLWVHISFFSPLPPEKKVFSFNTKYLPKHQGVSCCDLLHLQYLSDASLFLYFPPFVRDSFPCPSLSLSPSLSPALQAGLSPLFKHQNVLFTIREVKGCLSPRQKAYARLHHIMRSRTREGKSCAFE